MLKIEQLKSLNEFHLMIKEELLNHTQSTWLDEDWCEDYFHSLQRLDQALIDIEELNDVPPLYNR